MSPSSRICLSLALLIGGCAPILGQSRDPVYDGNGPGALRLPPLVVYQDSSGPLTYRPTAVGEGVPREVRGEACQSGLMFPVGLIWAAAAAGSPARAPAFLSAGWGAAGYAEAVSSALGAMPGARLADVRADLQTRIILGVWRQQCVRVTAALVSAPPAAGTERSP
jgi:hypothetical protein